MVVTEYEDDRLGWILDFPDESSMLASMEGKTYVEGSYSGGTHYVVNGQPTERPASPVTLDGMTLMNVPAGSTVLLDGQSYPAEGDVELEFPLPGTYQLGVIAWPHKDWEGEVVVP